MILGFVSLHFLFDRTCRHGRSTVHYATVTKLNKLYM